MLRSEIVAEARKWLDTPFHHNGRVLGAGVDCYGVVEMVGRALGVEIPPNIRYSRIPDESELLHYMNTYAVLVPRDQATEGDIAIIPHQGAMRHMGILTDKGILHAWEPAGRVVEHSIDKGWARLIRRVYAYPGVIDG
jgi:cell wall-associated NlpC family hydrolase